MTGLILPDPPSSQIPVEYDSEDMLRESDSNHGQDPKRVSNVEQIRANLKRRRQSITSITSISSIDSCASIDFDRNPSTSNYLFPQPALPDIPRDIAPLENAVTPYSNENSTEKMEAINFHHSSESDTVILEMKKDEREEKLHEAQLRLLEVQIQNSIIDAKVKLLSSRKELELKGVSQSELDQVLPLNFLCEISKSPLYMKR